MSWSPTIVFGVIFVIVMVLLFLLISKFVPRVGTIIGNATQEIRTRFCCDVMECKGFDVFKPQCGIFCSGVKCE